GGAQPLERQRAGHVLDDEALRVEGDAAERLQVVQASRDPVQVERQLRRAGRAARAADRAARSQALDAGGAVMAELDGAAGEREVDRTEGDLEVDLLEREAAEGVAALVALPPHPRVDDARV